MALPPVTRSATTAATTQTSSAQDFNPTEYLNQQLSGSDTAEFLKNLGAGYSSAFEKNVKAAVSKLGPNATQADVDKAISKEATNQQISKFIVNRAMNNVMNRIKDMNSDTYEG